MNNYKITTYQSKNGDVQCYLIDGDVYLSQKELTILLNKSQSSVSKYIKNLDKNGEIYSKMNITHSYRPTVLYTSKIVFELAKIIGDFSIIDFQKWVNEQLHSTEIIEDNHYKIVRFIQDNIELDVRISPEENTVWLTQEDMAELFETSQQNISKHLRNIFDSEELDFGPTHNFSLYVQLEGDRKVTRQVVTYNLDVVLAVGYRVNSKKGIVFRKWTTSVLTNYLKNGYAINENRVLAFQENINSLNQNVISLNSKINEHELRLKKIEDRDTNDILIFEGTVFDALIIITRIIERAHLEIVLIDPYCDLKTLNFLKGKRKEVALKIITSQKYKVSKRDFVLFNQEYGGLGITIDDSYHDRYLIIDNECFYHLGASLNYLGKRLSQITKIVDEDIIRALQKRIKDKYNE